MPRTSQQAEVVLLVGAGPMAIEYAKVLRALGRPFLVIGRGDGSAARAEKAIGVPVVRGGLEAWLRQAPAVPRRAIVAVTENVLGDACVRLVNSGVRSILVEKPGGANAEDIRWVARKAQQADVPIFVGYNRRFYSSVLRAEAMIREDGGLTSFSFEFTEWSHVIARLEKAPGVKEQWFLHNSTHVIDLAFHLGGRPGEMACFTAGGLSWHPSASVFAGAGVSESGALFSYHANWEAPGRWGLELLTPKRRLILRPMEKLQVQAIGSVAVDPVTLDDALDVTYKPGLYRQTIAFLDERRDSLPTIDKIADALPCVLRIGGMHLAERECVE